jgi:hypothetical protein
VGISADSTATVTKVATSLAPAIEQVNALAISAQHSAPIFTKAAIGLGAVALATLSTGPEQPQPVPASAAAGITATTVDNDSAAPSVVAAPVETIAATTAPSALPPEAAVASVAALPESVDPEELLAADPSAAPATDASTTETPTTAAPDTTAVPTTIEVIAPPVTTPEVTTPPVTEPPAVALTGGSLSVSGLSVTPSGPRIDVAGVVSLNLGGSTVSGSLGGRLSIAADIDASGRQRFDGVLTLSLDQGGTLEVRLAGHATGLDAGESPATSFNLTGQFRVAGGEALGLVPGGGFSGLFDPASLALTLSA